MVAGNGLQVQDENGNSKKATDPPTSFQAASVELQKNFAFKVTGVGK